MLKHLVFFLTLLNAATLRAQLTVSIINVGQGDAIYIELPSGKNVLIDGGPSAAPLMAFMKQKGVTKLDNVVLTHPHNDHYTGLNSIFEQMDVKDFYDTKMDNTQAVGDDKMRASAASKPGCTTHYPVIGEDLKWDPNVAVKVLNSCPTPVKSGINDDINDCSIVLQFRYNGNSILFMGDAEIPIEEAIMSKFGASIKSVILKVAHHGARYASSDKFLAVVQPKYAYISVGLNNVFGHPHKEALDRLNASGAKILLTTEGTQSFTIPAPNKDQSAPVEPILNGAAMTAEQKFTDMTLTWTPDDHVEAGPDSPAVAQLKAYAAPEAK